MAERSRARVRLALLLVVVTVIQTSVGADLRVDGVAPDLLLVVAICAGLFGGPRQGVLIGFSAGLLSDLWMTDTPLGLAALTFCLVGYGVGVLRTVALPEGRLIIPAAVLVFSVVGVIGFIGLGELLGQAQLVAGGRSAVVRIVVIESLCNTVASPLVAWLYHRAGRDSGGAEELGGGRSRTGAPV